MGNLKILMKFVELFVNLLKIKLYFSKPDRKNILLYDSHSKPYAEILFKTNNFAIYDTRYESLNLYVFIFTICRNGIFNLKHNYKVNFFNYVKPKIVYTIIDNNIGFFKLKNYFPEIFFIADQKGVRDNQFYNICLTHLKKNPREKLKVDIFFCFGLNEKERLSKIIKGKIIPLGNTLNNELELKKNISKINKLAFISSGHNTKTFLNRDIKIFKNLNIFCKKNKLKLIFLEKGNRKRYDFLKKRLGFEFSYIESGDNKIKSKFLKKDTLFVFIISTFGYEILSMGLKCVSLNHTQFNHGFKIYKKKGPFWVNAPSFNYNYESIAKIIKKVINYDKNKWEKIYKFYSKEILVYDRKNMEKKKLIKDYSSASFN